MCGIIGIIDINLNIADKMLQSLALLEYRGYDSAGLAVLNEDMGIIKFNSIHSVGKISELCKLYNQNPIRGNIGIGHTRWATHGVPKITNTHPISTKDIALVHNGIIENYIEIKTFLLENKYKFLGETDTEVLVTLIQYYIDSGLSFEDSVLKTIGELKGMFCFVVMHKDSKSIIGVRHGLSLVLGIGDNTHYITSDASAISDYTDKAIYLCDGDIVEIKNNDYKLTNIKKEKINRKIVNIPQNVKVNIGKFKHFMLKEIYEQPFLINKLLHRYTDDNGDLKNKLTKINFNKFKSLYIIACGTSFYGGNIAKYFIERLTNKNVIVEIASEFRTRNTNLHKNCLYIFISQSGETADTLASLKKCKKLKLKTLGIVNVETSQISREVDEVLFINAGIEIAVASTKTFTSSITMLFLIYNEIIKQSGYNKQNERNKQNENNDYKKEDVNLFNYITLLQNDVHKISMLMEDIELQVKDVISAFDKNDMSIPYALCIGREILYPMAMEASLKIKELCYIPTEGIAAGEFKHGPIALIEKGTLVFVFAQNDEVFDKLSSNMEEIFARGANIVLIAPKHCVNKAKHLCSKFIEMPEISYIGVSILYAIPLQMLAYHMALYKNNDVDKPRNLAKSVTVE